MASLDQLVQEALGGIINTGGLPTEESLYQRQAQSEQENTFGRGLGISSVTRDALAKARVDASLAAQQAQLAALGQAAGVAQNELNRGQQGTQFSQQLGLQKKALGQQSDIARNNLLAQGLGLGVGGLAQVAGHAFKPEILGGLGRLTGRGSAVSPMGGREVPLAGQLAPSANTGLGGDIGAPDSGWDVGGLGSVGLPDLAGWGDIGGSIASPDILGSLGGLGDLGLWDLTAAAADLPDFSMLWAP